MSRYWAWWHIPAIPALGRQEQKSEGSVGFSQSTEGEGCSAGCPQPTPDTQRALALLLNTTHRNKEKPGVLVTCCNRAPYRKQKCGKTDLVSSERLQSIMNKESVEQGCEATDPIASESENREGGVCKLSPPSLF